MEEKQFELSNRLYKIAAVLIIGLVVFGVVNAYVALKNVSGDYPRELTVTGEGKAYVIPDIANLSLSVENEGSDIANIVAVNTEKMNKIIADIKALGIDAKDIKTSQYNLSPQYNWTESRGQIFTGYKITNSIAVKIRDFTKIGNVLNKGTEGGATLVGSLQFSVDNPEAVRQEARNKAIEQAKASAQNIAKASGIRLGKVLNVSEGSNPYPYPMYSDAKGAGTMESSVPPTIEAGQTEVDITVTLTYRVK